MTWLLAAQQQSSSSGSTAGAVIAVIVAVALLVVLVVYLVGHADGRLAERDDSSGYRRARNSIDGLIDDAEREIRRQLWRKP